MGDNPEDNKVYQDVTRKRDADTFELQNKEAAQRTAGLGAAEKGTPEGDAATKKAEAVLKGAGDKMRTEFISTGHFDREVSQQFLPVTTSDGRDIEVDYGLLALDQNLGKFDTRFRLPEQVVQQYSNYTLPGLPRRWDSNVQPFTEQEWKEKIGQVHEHGSQAGTGLAQAIYNLERAIASDSVQSHHIADVYQDPELLQRYRVATSGAMSKEENTTKMMGVYNILAKDNPKFAKQFNKMMGDNSPAKGIAVRRPPPSWLETLGAQHEQGNIAALLSDEWDSVTARKYEFTDKVDLEQITNIYPEQYRPVIEKAYAEHGSLAAMQVGMNIREDLEAADIVDRAGLVKQFGGELLTSLNDPLQVVAAIKIAQGAKYVPGATQANIAMAAKESAKVAAVVNAPRMADVTYGWENYLGDVYFETVLGTSLFTAGSLAAPKVKQVRRDMQAKKIVKQRQIEQKNLAQKAVTAQQEINNLKPNELHSTKHKELNAIVRENERMLSPAQKKSDTFNDTVKFDDVLHEKKAKLEVAARSKALIKQVSQEKSGTVPVSEDVGSGKVDVELEENAAAFPDLKEITTISQTGFTQVADAVMKGMKGDNVLRRVLRSHKKLNREFLIDTADKAGVEWSAKKTFNDYRDDLAIKLQKDGNLTPEEAVKRADDIMKASRSELEEIQKLNADLMFLASAYPKGDMPKSIAAKIGALANNQAQFSKIPVLELLARGSSQSRAAGRASRMNTTEMLDGYLKSLGRVYKIDLDKVEGINSKEFKDKAGSLIARRDIQEISEAHQSESLNVVGVEDLESMSQGYDKRLSMIVDLIEIQKGTDLTIQDRKLLGKINSIALQKLKEFQLDNLPITPDRKLAKRTKLSTDEISEQLTKEGVKEINPKWAEFVKDFLEKPVGNLGTLAKVKARLKKQKTKLSKLKDDEWESEKAIASVEETLTKLNNLKENATPKEKVNKVAPKIQKAKEDLAQAKADKTLNLQGLKKLKVKLEEATKAKPNTKDLKATSKYENDLKDLKHAIKTKQDYLEVNIPAQIRHAELMLRKHESANSRFVDKTKLSPEMQKSLAKVDAAIKDQKDTLADLETKRRKQASDISEVRKGIDKSQKTIVDMNDKAAKAAKSHKIQRSTPEWVKRSKQLREGTLEVPDVVRDIGELKQHKSAIRSVAEKQPKDVTTEEYYSVGDMQADLDKLTSTPEYATEMQAFYKELREKGVPFEAPDGTLEATTSGRSAVQINPEWKNAVDKKMQDLLDDPTTQGVDKADVAEIKRLNYMLGESEELEMGTIVEDDPTGLLPRTFSLTDKHNVYNWNLAKKGQDAQRPTLEGLQVLRDRLNYDILRHLKVKEIKGKTKAQTAYQRKKLNTIRKNLLKNRNKVIQRMIKAGEWNNVEDVLRANAQIVKELSDKRNALKNFNDSNKKRATEAEIDAELTHKATQLAKGTKAYKTGKLVEDTDAFDDLVQQKLKELRQVTPAEKAELLNATPKKEGEAAAPVDSEKTKVVQAATDAGVTARETIANDTKTPLSEDEVDEVLTSKKESNKTLRTKRKIDLAVEKNVKERTAAIGKGLIDFVATGLDDLMTTAFKQSTLLSKTGDGLNIATKAMSDRLLGSDLTTMRFVAVHLTSMGSVVKGVQRRATMALIRDTKFTQFTIEILPDFKKSITQYSIAKGKGYLTRLKARETNASNSSTQTEFNEDLFRTIEALKQGKEVVDPVMKDFANKWKNFMDKMHDELVDANVNGFSKDRKFTWYIPHVWKNTNLKKMIEDNGLNKVEKLIKRGYESKGHDATTAQEYATDLIKWINKQDEVQTDMYMPTQDSRSRARKDIDLTVEIDGLRLLDLVDTDVPNIATRYANRAAGWIGLSKSTNGLLKSDLDIDIFREQIKAEAAEKDIKGRKELAMFDDIMSMNFGRPTAGAVAKDGSKAEGGLAPELQSVKDITALSMLGFRSLAQIAETGMQAVHLITASFSSDPIAKKIFGMARESSEDVTLIREIQSLTGLTRELEHNIRYGQHLLEEQADTASSKLRQITTTAADKLTGGGLKPVFGRVQDKVNGYNMVRRMQSRLIQGSFVLNLSQHFKTGKGKMSLERLTDTGAVDANGRNEVLEDVFKKYVTYDKNGLPKALNYDKWPKEAQEQLAYATNHVESTYMLRALIGELPPWMNKPLMTLAAQFRQVPILAMTKHVKRSLQFADQEAVLGTLLNAAMAGMSRWAGMAAVAGGTALALNQDIDLPELEELRISQYISQFGIFPDLTDLVTDAYHLGKVDWGDAKIADGIPNEGQQMLNNIPTLSYIQTVASAMGNAKEGDKAKAFEDAYSVLPGSNVHIAQVLSNVIVNKLKE